MKIKTKNMVKHGGQYHRTGSVLDVSDETAAYLFELDAAESAESVAEPARASLKSILKAALKPFKAVGDERQPKAGEQDAGADEQNAVGDEQDAGGEPGAAGSVEGDSGAEPPAGDSGEGGSGQGSQADTVLDELVMAAQGAIAQGKITDGGKPTVKAMEEILKRNISAADRDRAWEAIKPPVNPEE